jgi:hypothetical protein
MVGKGLGNEMSESICWAGLLQIEGWSIKIANKAKSCLTGLLDLESFDLWSGRGAWNMEPVLMLRHARSAVEEP